ncbi:MAG: hypothetical protein M1837_001870 [Sclerophora amabilis]|nr:MAG: hypothetical protein M1837_001870 [Sclerophora amabilis]
MDKAKAAVGNFLHHSGHNDTTVHEKVAPAVTNETIQKAHHQETTTALDRERHQDHYHTTIQPVKDREVLPEQHSHNLASVENRHIQHGNDDDVRRRLEQERAQFHDTTTQASTRTTESTAPTVAGEHVHHHVHETIQPVVQKETIQPSVVHTTVPIHEVHQHEAKHHAASALPAVSMSEFKKQGGALTGREERVDGFKGEPKPVGSTLGSSGIDSHHRGTAGPHDSNVANKADPRVDSDLDGSRNAGYSGSGTGAGYGNTTSGTTGSGAGYGSTGAGSTGLGTTNSSGYTGSTGPTGPHKSAGLNKMDPRVDSDRDGKKGFSD